MNLNTCKTRNAIVLERRPRWRAFPTQHIIHDGEAIILFFAHFVAHPFSKRELNQRGCSFLENVVTGSYTSVYTWRRRARNLVPFWGFWVRKYNYTNEYLVGLGRNRSTRRVIWRKDGHGGNNHRETTSEKRNSRATVKKLPRTRWGPIHDARVSVCFRNRVIIIFARKSSKIRYSRRTIHSWNNMFSIVRYNDSVYRNWTTKCRIRFSILRFHFRFRYIFRSLRNAHSRTKFHVWRSPIGFFVCPNFLKFDDLNSGINPTRTDDTIELSFL